MSNSFKKIISTAGTIALLGFGLASTSSAQSEPSPPSPAALLGVQERSLPIAAKRNLAQNPASPTSAQTAEEDGLVLYRLDDKTRVVVGPAQPNISTGVGFGENVPGDNRVRLLHDLEP